MGMKMPQAVSHVGAFMKILKFGFQPRSGADYPRFRLRFETSLASAAVFAAVGAAQVVIRW